MISVEVVPGISGGGIKESGGEGEVWYIWYSVRTFVMLQGTRTQHNNKKKCWYGYRMPNSFENFVQQLH
jgi:hypothetical protein